MQIVDVLKMFWSKIARPNSVCPDIEIGFVRRILGEVMASEVKDRGILADEVQSWVLGQLLVSPMLEVSLSDDWYETNRVYRTRIEPPNGNYEDEAYQKAVEDQYAAEDREMAQRASEVTEAIRNLIGRGLVTMISGGGYPKYFGDPAAYQMAIKMSSV